MSDDIDLNALETALPKVLEWIETTLKACEPDAVPVSTLGYDRLLQHYPLSLLDNTRVVRVEAIPLPPFHKFGLGDLADRLPHGLLGITYKDTFFVLKPEMSDKLCFHEMVHIVQWQHLGPEKFLRAYGVGLSQLGYRNIPIEKMAYVFEEAFESNALPPNLVATIQEQTDNIWNEVDLLLREKTGSQ